MRDRRQRHEDFMKERRSGRSDRRAHSRGEASISMELTAGGDLYFHVSANISVGGAFFGRAIPHPVGTQVQVSFQLPTGGAPIRCAAEVVNLPERSGMGMGVRFQDLADEDRGRLEAFVSTLDAPTERGKPR